MKRRIIIVTVVVVLVAVVTGLWLVRRNRRHQQAAAELLTATVTRGPLRVTVSATGVLEPLTTIEVKSRSGGEIKRMFVEAGDYVRAGQLIAQIDPTTLQRQVDQARAPALKKRRLLSSPPRPVCNRRRHNWNRQRCRWSRK